MCDTHDTVRILGRGATAVVCLKRESEGRTYVVKQITKGVVDKNSVMNELFILDRMRNDCDDYILCFNHFSEDSRFYYIVTEHLGDYIDLSDYIIHSKTLPNTQNYIQICENLKAGLNKIHSMNIAHCDIKPGNIMINPHTFEIKYIDFGEACIGDKCTKGTRGTPFYNPPELIDIKRVSYPDTLKKWKKMDYWGLRVTIFELMMHGDFFDEYLVSVVDKRPISEVHKDSSNSILNRVFEIMRSDLPKSFVKRYCADYLHDKHMCYYLQKKIVPLLHAKPKKRKLILN